MKNIITAIEFDHRSGNVLGLVEKLAQSFHSKIWLIHVSAPEPDFVGYKVGPEYVREHTAHALRSEHQHIQQIAGEMREKGLDVTPLAIQGPTAEKILRECERLNTDLLVIGRNKHGLLHGLTHQGVTKRLVRESSCPVLVVPLD